MTHYSESYYENVYAGFDNEEFALRWAVGCALVAGYAKNQFENALEFGAGLGQNLAVIHANKKWVVDISDVSQRACEARGFNWRNKLDHVPDQAFDMILSRHSLEHTPDPFSTLQKLRRKAAENANFYLIVPLERSLAVSSLRQFDDHKHLFAWSPEALKNLLLETGWTPTTLAIHNDRLMRRMVALLPRYERAFLLGRRCINALLPKQSAEIIVHARS
jgi:Methyltransferase domain